MIQPRTLVFAMLAAAVLVLDAGSARADMCFGGPHPPEVGSGGGAGSDAGADAATDGHARNDTAPRRTGSAFLIVAVISGVFLYGRRKAADEKS